MPWQSLENCVAGDLCQDASDVLHGVDRHRLWGAGIVSTGLRKVQDLVLARVQPQSSQARRRAHHVPDQSLDALTEWVSRVSAHPGIQLTRSGLGP